jgi:putative sigma-54 modulation protein
MDINITGRHLEITEAMRDHIFGKINNSMSDFKHIESVSMILEVEKYRHKAEIIIQAARHFRVEASDTSNDMYTSIDGVIEKACRQMRRHRDKQRSHKNRESLARNEIEAEGAWEDSNSTTDLE